MASVHDAMESLGAVLMAGPNSNRVRLNKRRNVVDIHWAPGAGLEDGADSKDVKRRLTNTSMLFEELKVSLASTSHDCFSCLREAPNRLCCYL
mmetsp:Transcript_2494/g.5236  ORF Transcript_2494/g.5236 Transcript_2494/m.5236 type:complete len:93 (+) Transcript_2494:146-424(+)